MKKLLVAIPSSNYSSEKLLNQAMIDRRKVAEILAGESLELVNLNCCEASSDLIALSELLRLASTSDYIYFSDNWNTDFQTIILHACAKYYNLNILND